MRKILSVALLFCMFFNLLPFEWLPSVLRENVTKAESNLTREDFKQFEGMVDSNDYFTFVLKENGQVLPLGSSNNEQLEVKNWDNIKSISAGYEHVVGLKEDGTVLAAGTNNYGELDVSSWKDIVQVSAGQYFTAGLKRDGTVVITGDTSLGQNQAREWTDIVSVSAGGTHIVGLKQDGTVVAAGLNTFGQIDVSNWTDIVSISAGTQHTVGLKSDGTVLAIGNNINGRTNVYGWKDIVSISAGGFVTMGLKSDGTAVLVGDVQYNYAQQDVSQWKNVVAISAGWYTYAGIHSDGTVSTTQNYYSRQAPRQSVWNEITSIDTGWYQYLGLKANGTVISSGSNEQGESNVYDWRNITQATGGKFFSVGLKEDGTVITAGQGNWDTVKGWTDIVSVAAGESHIVGVKKNGTVVGAVNGGSMSLDWTDIVQVSSFGGHTLGLKRDGTVVASGNNSYGQLNVSSWRNIIAIAAGLDFSLGLRSDGTVVAVGNNKYGQLNVSGWTNIGAISAGYNQSVGLKKDGTVVAVGNNQAGQLNITEWKDIDAISAGISTTLGLKKDGTVINTDSSKLPSEIFKPQYSINKRIVKPNDEVRIKLSTGNFYTVSNSLVSLNGGVNLANQEMTQVADGEFEYTYKVQPADSGIVNVNFPGTADFFDQAVTENDFFRVIPLQSIRASKTVASPGDKVSITVTFYESVKPGFQLALGRAEYLADTQMTEVAGSNGTKYIYTYTVPYNHFEGAIDVSLNDVETANGSRFLTYKERSVFTKQNRVAPVSSLIVSKEKAKMGDDVTITANFSETIKNGVKLSLDGGAQMAPTIMNEVSGSNGKQYTANYRVPEGISGTVNAHITEAYDINNSLSKEYVSNNLFSVDGIRPDVSVTASQSVAKTGDRVLLTAKFSEPVKPSFTLSLVNGVSLPGLSMTEVEGSNSTVFTYEYVVKDGDQGQVYTAFNGVEDLFGNTMPGTTIGNVFQADGVNPDLLSVESENQDYAAGDYAHIIATFTESVKPGVKIKLSGGINDEEYVMSEVQGSNGNQYELYYEIKEGQKGIVSGLLTNVVDFAGNEITYSKEEVFYISDPSNANLANVSASSDGVGYSFNYEFSSDIGTYTTYLPSHVRYVYLNADTQDRKALVEGAGYQSLVQGENVFILKVTSSNLNTKYYKVVIHVADDQSPVITGVEDKSVNIYTTFEPTEGVVASDNVDGEITSLIQTGGAVDTSKPGTYRVTYSVSDKAGNTTRVERYITVVDNIPPAAPIVDPVGDNKIIITGTAEPNGNVVAKAYGQWLGGAQVAEDGKYFIAIPKQQAGTEISVYAYDPYGNQSEATKVVVKDVTAPDKPVVNEVTDKDTSISGKAEASSKIRIIADGKLIVMTTVGSDGNFLIHIPVQKAGTKLVFTSIDQAGNVSDAETIVVKDVTAPDGPIVNEVTDKDNTVSGQAEAASTIIVKANGFVIAKVTADEEGWFIANILPQKAGTDLVITATDSVGNVSHEVTIAVKDFTVPVKPIVNPVTDQNDFVQGKAEAGSRIEVKFNGQVISTGVAGVDGNFTIDIPVQKAGTDLTIISIDQAGNISESTSLVVLDKTPPEKPVVNEVTDKDTSITGQAEPESKVEIKVEDMIVGTDTAEVDGTFTVEIPLQKAGSKLFITSIDKSGNVSLAEIVVVKDVTAPEKPVVNEVTDQSTTVTGEAEAGSTVEMRVDGSVIGSGTAGEDGKFIVAIPVQKAGTELIISSTDIAKNESESTRAVVRDATAPEKPVVNEITDQSTTVTGDAEIGSAVEIKANGSVIGTQTVGEAGQFIVTIPAQKEGTVIEVTATDTAGNVSEVRTVTVLDGTSPAAPKVTEINDQSTSVSGTTEAGAKVYVVYTSPLYGVLVSTGFADENGNYQVAIPVQDAGSTIKVIAADARGNESEAVTMVVKDATAPNTPQVNEVTDCSQEVSGTTEAGANVTVRVGLIEYGLTEYNGKADEQGNFNVSIPIQSAGTAISVFVTDEAGNISEINQIFVKDVTPPDVPIVNEVTDKDLSVTGQAEAGATVGVTIIATSYEAKADEAGKFSINIPRQEAGTILHVYAYDANGNGSPYQSITVTDKTAPLEPEVNAVNNKDAKITGQAEAGSKIEVKRSGTLIGSGETGVDGKFIVNIPVQKAGVELDISATDKAGNVSKSTRLLVKDVIAPEKPEVNEVTDKDYLVTGEAEAGSKVEVKVGSTVIGTGTAAADDEFKLTISVQKAGTELVITATDIAGNVSQAEKVVVKDVTAPDKPVVNEVSDKDTSVSGQAEAGSTVEVKVNGTVIGTGTAGEDGHFNVIIPVQKAGMELVLSATDKAGNVSEIIKVLVIDKTAPEKPVVNEVTDKDNSVTGKAEVGSKVEVKVKDSVIGTVTVGEDSQLIVTIPVQKAGTELVVTATDKAGNVSEATTVVVKDVTAPGKPVVNE
ncbi:Ig-like domain-containing protein, partial [Neobacillus drentensis]|uniref:Ig-like domain-containing protein n=1 Tax=Neobacillus drentensis TaxID=220684 RepID=UPI003000E8C3